MALKYKCTNCGRYIVPRRIKGYYLGDNECIKIWECSGCNHLWR